MGKMLGIVTLLVHGAYVGLAKKFVWVFILDIMKKTD